MQQQIIYREISGPAGEPSKDRTTVPGAEDVAGLCTMMQQWALGNGWRISSIVPVAGLRDRPYSSSVMPTHTVGLIFICEKS